MTSATLSLPVNSLWSRTVHNNGVSGPRKQPFGYAAGRRCHCATRVSASKTVQKVRAGRQSSCGLCQCTLHVLTSCLLCPLRVSSVAAATFANRLLHHMQEETSLSPSPSLALTAIARELKSSGAAKEQLRLLMQYSRELPPLPQEARTWNNRVMGCTSQVRQQAWSLWGPGVHRRTCCLCML